MKNYILPLVMFFALLSCEEENPQPVDPFAGSWHFISQDTPIEISFKVVQEGSVLNIVDRSVIHPAIPVEEQDNNQIRTYERFENGMGYGKIEITSRGSFYYKITLIYNRFVYNTDDEKYDMAVYDVQIDIPSEPFIVLQDQTFTKDGV